jgi:hypothetical protein
MFLVVLSRLVVLGGAAYLLLAWLWSPTAGLVAAALVGAKQLLGGAWAVSSGATTCHSCGQTFTTR